MKEKTFILDTVLLICYTEKPLEKRKMLFFQDPNGPFKTLNNCPEQAVFNACVEYLTHIFMRLIFDISMFTSLWKCCEIAENKRVLAAPTPSGIGANGTHTGPDNN